MGFNIKTGHKYIEFQYSNFQKNDWERGIWYSVHSMTSNKTYESDADIKNEPYYYGEDIAGVANIQKLWCDIEYDEETGKILSVNSETIRIESNSFIPGEDITIAYQIFYEAHDDNDKILGWYGATQGIITTKVALDKNYNVILYHYDKDNPSEKLGENTKLTFVFDSNDRDWYPDTFKDLLSYDTLELEKIWKISYCTYLPEKNKPWHYNIYDEFELEEEGNTLVYCYYSQKKILGYLYFNNQKKEIIGAKFYFSNSVRDVTDIIIY